jgi:serine protease Do
MGIGFAIPTNMAGPIVEALKTKGQVSRGFLGVSIQEVDRDIRQALRLKEKGGVLIADVQPDGPAARAGIKSGDVVLSVNETAVHSPGHFRNLIAQSEANKKVKLRLVRDGQSKALDVELGELQDENAAERGSGGAEAGVAKLDGLSFSDLDESLRQRLDVPLGVSGAVIVRVQPGSKAAEANLRPGDLILQINGKAVRGASEASQVYQAVQGAKLLQVLRRGAKQFVVIK